MFAASKTASVSGGYQISRSLRFNSADSAYLNRTPASAGNRRTWTFSAWVKLSALTGNNILFSASNGSSTQFYINFSSANTLDVVDYSGSTQLQKTTTQVFRDPSAFYHLVVVLDTTQASASNRFRLYINGVEVTAFSGTNITPSQNYDGALNSTVPHAYGRDEFGDNNYYSGYLTETYLIDGQALTPSSFGETNAQTGVWQPKAYSGSYGTNGFYLNFSNNSNTTAATLGADYSGNGNNWTPNNFSVTAGAGNDSLVDSPTSYGVDTGVGGTVRGNYATLNPLDKLSTVTAPLNGNLQYNTANSTGLMRGTLGVKSAKWYYEATITTVPSGGSIYIGVKDSSDPTMTSSNGLGSNSGTTNEFGYAQSGYKQNNGTGTNIGTTLGAGDVLMVAYDLDGGYIWWGKNGTWISSGNPATGANPMFSTLTSTNGYSPSLGYNSIYTDGVVNFNFGQRAFAYTAPSGFKALCTQNLPTPTIGATSATLAGKYFNPVLYTGNGTTLSVTGVGFQPDWVWAKCRGVAVSHRLVDAVRGVTKSLFSNLTDAETTESGLTAFNSDGFTVGSATGMNYNGEPFVAWNWRASNATAVTNTAGSITSTVSANTTSGFSVVTYGANGTSGATVGHGLGTTPTFVIIKNRSAVSHWRTGTSVTASAASPVTGYLSTTSSFAADSTAFQTLGSTTITLGNSGDVNSTSGGGYVAYCFAPISGYSAFGSYTGNGSADGPFVFTGMRPAYVMIKRTDSTASWYVLDVARNTYNAANLNLYPNLSNAEATFSALDILSNGFKIRNSDADFNASGGTYFYMAFASNPFKYSLAR